MEEARRIRRSGTSRSRVKEQRGRNKGSARRCPSIEILMVNNFWNFYVSLFTDAQSTPFAQRVQRARLSAHFCEIFLFHYFSNLRTHLCRTGQADRSINALYSLRNVNKNCASACRVRGLCEPHLLIHSYPGTTSTYVGPRYWKLP